jgi:septum formation protein
MNNPPLVLASASPRRRDLLARIGVVPVDIIPAEIDETPRKGELPRVYVRRMAREKALAVDAGGRFLLAADTVVAVGRRILPKAETEADIRACLRMLSGRRHHVMTAVLLRAPDGVTRERLCESVVTFSRLSPGQIDAYVQDGEGLGKAGGYAIQGQAEAFVRFMSGSHSNIVGLPLFETAGLLRGHGWVLA